MAPGRVDAGYLRRASQGHPRLWLVLHQKNATDLPAPFLEAYRKVGGDSFTGVEPSMTVTVELYELMEHGGR